MKTYKVCLGKGECHWLANSYSREEPKYGQLYGGFFFTQKFCDVHEMFSFVWIIYPANEVRRVYVRVIWWLVGFSESKILWNGRIKKFLFLFWCIAMKLSMHEQHEKYIDVSMIFLWIMVHCLYVMCPSTHL